MKDILLLTEKPNFEQLKMILSSPPHGVYCVVFGIDILGCSHYPYKIDYTKNPNEKNICVCGESFSIYI